MESQYCLGASSGRWQWLRVQTALRDCRWTVKCWLNADAIPTRPSSSVYNRTMVAAVRTTYWLSPSVRGFSQISSLHALVFETTLKKEGLGTHLALPYLTSAHPHRRTSRTKRNFSKSLRRLLTNSLITLCSSYCLHVREELSWYDFTLIL